MRRVEISIAKVLAALLLMGTAPAFAAEDGWLLRQQSPYSAYSGNQNVFLTKTRLKMQGSNIRIFYDVKTKNIEAYNTNTKEYYSGPAEVWVKKYVTLPKEKYVEPTKKTQDIAGMTASLYYLTKKDPTVHHLREIWATEKISVPADMCKVMWGMCGLHAAPGVPMRVTRLLGRDKTEMLLDTIEVAKTKFEDKDFSRPKGYKRVKSELELLLHASEESSLGDMLGK